MIRLKIVLIIICITHSVIFFGQTLPKEYSVFAKRADSLYKLKNYKEAAVMFSKAFQTFEGKGKINDRYKAACCWAMANNADSAFFNLDRIATKLDSSTYEFIKIEKDLKPLRTDERWQLFLDRAKANRVLRMSEREIVWYYRKKPINSGNII